MEYATQYAEVAKLHKQGMRGLARKAALDLLGLKTKVAPSKKLWEAPRVQLIYIHHIFEDEREGFRNMLKLFAEHFTFISYADAVIKILTGQMDKPYMAFSSDDGFKNNLIAAEVLEEFGTTACFFLNPGTIGLTIQTKSNPTAPPASTFHRSNSSPGRKSTIFRKGDTKSVPTPCGTRNYPRSPSKKLKKT